jgi:hypothetical protein
MKENAECMLWKAKFCTAHGSQLDVINHMKTKKHNLTGQIKASNYSISNCLSTKNISVFINFLSCPVFWKKKYYGNPSLYLSMEVKAGLKKER